MTAPATLPRRINDAPERPLEERRPGAVPAQPRAVTGPQSLLRPEPDAFCRAPGRAGEQQSRPLTLGSAFRAPPAACGITPGSVTQSFLRPASAPMSRPGHAVAPPEAPPAAPATPPESSRVAAERIQGRRLTGTIGDPADGGENRAQDLEWVRSRLGAHIDPQTNSPYLDYTPGAPANGTRDEAFTSALNRFQEDRLGHFHGQVEPGSRTEAALAASPAHRLDGSVGLGGRNNPRDIARVQSELEGRGLLAPGSYQRGVLDPKSATDPTMLAIHAYQAKHARRADGRIDVDRTTHRALRERPAADEPLGLRGAVGARATADEASVRTVQDRLREHGVLREGQYRPGTFDQATDRALREFQSRFMRRPDGRIDPSGRTSHHLSLTPHALKEKLTEAGPGAATQPIADAESFYRALIRSDTAQRRGINNTPPAHIRENMQALWQRFEPLWRRIQHLNPTISSGYRSPQLNRAIPGSNKSSSPHMSGLAVDLIASDMRALKREVRAFALENPGFMRRIIDETHGTGAHSHTEWFDPRQPLTATPTQMTAHRARTSRRGRSGRVARHRHRH